MRTLPIYKVDCKWRETQDLTNRMLNCNSTLPNEMAAKDVCALSRVLSGADTQKSRSSGIVMLAGTYAILDKNWLGIT